MTEESIDKIVGIVGECTPIITLIDNKELNLDVKMLTNILESTDEKIITWNILKKGCSGFNGFRNTFVYKCN